MMTKQSVINLARGHPNPSLLATDELRQVLRDSLLLADNNNNNGAAAADDDDEDEAASNNNNNNNNELMFRNGLQYGHEAGNPAFLRELASFLERQCAHDHDDQDDDDDHADAGRAAAGTITPTTTTTTHFFATMGVSHALDLICATQTKPGDVVLVESPTYFLVKGILNNHQLQVEALPMHHHSNGSGGGGVNVPLLIQTWKDCVQNNQPLPRLLYIVPTHGNPTGHTMPLADRRELIRAALEYGVLVVADEVYHLLDWSYNSSNNSDDDDNNDEMSNIQDTTNTKATAEPPTTTTTRRQRRRPVRMAKLSARLAKKYYAVDNSSCSSKDGGNNNNKPSGGCVSISSFTKIFGPGIRCGWIEASSSLGIIESVVQYGYIQSQGGCGPWIGEIMTAAMARRVTDAVVERLQLECASRATRLCRALSVEPRIQLVNNIVPKGGYFCWILFPAACKAVDLQMYCAEQVKFLPGVRCDIVGNHHDDDDDTDTDAALSNNKNGRRRLFESNARLCFADMDEELLEEGAKRLVACFREYMLMLEERGSVDVDGDNKSNNNDNNK